MRYYELLYIVNPNLEDDKINNIIDEIGKEISKYKVTIINHYMWGKKRLAYPIKNNKYGTYILLQFSAERFEFIVEFERFMILNKVVIRHQIVKLENEPAKVDNIEQIVKIIDSIDDDIEEIADDDILDTLDQDEEIDDLEEDGTLDDIEVAEEISEGEQELKEEKE